MKFNALAALFVASVMCVGGVLVSGEARADHHEEQTISGDSGSADAALSAKEAKKAAKKERKRAKRAAKAERAQKRKDAKQAKLAAAAEAKGKDAKGKDGKKKSGLICKREKSSGSHMRRKVCRTPEEMEERREKDQRLLRDINPAGGVTPG